MEVWLPLLTQVPLVAAFIYFVLEHNKQDATERHERNQEWAVEVQRRDEQWRGFLTQMNVNNEQMNQQWREFLTQIHEANELTMSAVLKQLESTDAQLRALAVEVKVAHIKFAQMEQFLVTTVDEMRQHRYLTQTLREG